MSGSGRTISAVALMLAAPPLLLVLWVQLVRPIWQGSEWLALLVAGLSGLAGVIVAPWSERAKAIVAATYCLIAVAALPFLLLAAVCSTGDCL